MRIKWVTKVPATPTRGPNAKQKALQRAKSYLFELKGLSMKANRQIFMPGIYTRNKSTIRSRT